MKIQRNLSGIYIREKLPDGSWGNICFVDMTEEQQKEFLKKKPEEWKEQLCIMLANTLNEVGEHFDISKE